MAEYFACWLKIPEEFQEQIEQIVSEKYNYDVYLVETKPRILEYLFDEIKWGELSFLDDLHEMGIPFNFSNDDSDDCRFIKCRFTPDGEMILQDYLESDTKIDADTFIDEIDKCKTPEQKLDYINRLYISCSNILNHLPWDNQIEYGKLYRTRKLIEPS